MSDLYIYEFLYRGKADGDSAWHLILASSRADEFGRPQRPSDPMTMAEAHAAGWPLPKIIETINQAALIELESLRPLKPRLAQALAEIDALTERFAGFRNDEAQTEAMRLKNEWREEQLRKVLSSL